MFYELQSAQLTRSTHLWWVKAAAISLLWVTGLTTPRTDQGQRLWQIEAAVRQQEAVIHEEMAEGGDVDVASGVPTATAGTRSSHSGANDGDGGGRRSRDMQQTGGSRNLQHYAGRLSKGGRAHYVAADGQDICDGGMLHSNRALTDLALLEGMASVRVTLGPRSGMKTRP